MEFKKVNKLKGPSEDTLIPLGGCGWWCEEKKAITGGRGKEGPWWERGQGGEEGNRSGIVVEQE